MVRRRAVLVLIMLLIVGGCAGSSDNGDSDGDELYQVATLDGLAAGAYDGLVSFDSVLEHGDFGLGTFDRLDGELIVLDGIAYRVPADGTPVEVDGDVTTPFAAVTFWESDVEFEISNTLVCADLQTAIDERIDDLQTPYAIKITGQFESMTTRSEEPQSPPYPALADVLANQIVFELTEVDATIVGFRLPEYMAGTNAAGYHFHAVTDDLDAGGHVLDCRTSSVTVELDDISSWQVDHLTISD